MELRTRSLTARTFCTVSPGAVLLLMGGAFGLQLFPLIRR